MFLAIFDLPVTPMLPNRVNWPFGLGEEAKNRFSRWSSWWKSSWISDPKNFNNFWSTSHSKSSYPGLSQLAFLFRRRSEKQIFKIAPWRPSWIANQNDFTLFFLHLQVTLMLPIKFRVNWPFSSDEEVKNRFSRWPPWWPSWISYRNYFSYFWPTSHPDTSYHFQVH